MGPMYHSHVIHARDTACHRTADRTGRTVRLRGAPQRLRWGRGREVEGSFGEFTGHYTGGHRMPVITVDRISYRTGSVFETLYLGKRALRGPGDRPETAECPRCASPETERLAESPVPGVWTVTLCRRCRCSWRSPNRCPTGHQTTAPDSTHDVSGERGQPHPGCLVIQLISSGHSADEAEDWAASCAG